MAKKKISKSSNRTDKIKKSRSKPTVVSEPTVNNMLVALQKTLSRVSRDSSEVPAGQARSLIVGNVAFELDIKCSLAPDEKLLLDDERGMPLKLKGEIVSDVGVELEKEGE